MNKPKINPFLHPCCICHKLASNYFNGRCYCPDHHPNKIKCKYKQFCHNCKMFVPTFQINSCCYCNQCKKIIRKWGQQRWT